MPDTGSGYGGKHTGEAAIEAARLAKAAGKPVKLVWTREEEFTWAYFRPAGVIDVRSAVDKNGRLTAWEFHNYNSGTSAIDTLYDVPNKKIEFHPVDAPLRSGSYRGLAGTANHFARECHMDETAVARRNRAAGVPAAQFKERTVQGGTASGGGQVQMGQRKFRDRRGIRKGQLCRDVCRGEAGCRQAASRGARGAGV